MSNRVIKWGVLSTADITSKVAPALVSAEASSSVVAIASRSKEKAAAWAKRYAPDAVAYGDYAQLLADENVDAVYIPLPSGLRNEWIIKAARAGKHVYAEKPFADGIEEAIQACVDAGVQFMDGTMWLHSARTAELRRRLDAAPDAADGIGRLRRVNAAFTFAAPSSEWLNGGNCRTDKSREPMGILGDQGWYPVGAILWAFNYELPVRVRVLHVVKNEKDTIVEASGVLYFADNRVASFDVGAMSAHRSWMELVGETGVIAVDDLTGGGGRGEDGDPFQVYFEPHVGSKRFRVSDVKGVERVVAATACDHVQALVADFAACVQSERVNDEWPRRTRIAHRVISALFASAEAGGDVVELTS